MKHSCLRISAVLSVIALQANVSAQSFADKYNDFRNEARNRHQSFKDESNRKYIEFLKYAWDRYEGKAPMQMPNDDTPVPPQPYKNNDSVKPVSIAPIIVNPLDDNPQPKPVEPVRETPLHDTPYFTTDFYGIECSVRLPENARLKVNANSSDAISDGWKRLSGETMNNAIRDCLEIRIRHNLCDWAYLSFLDKLCHDFCSDTNGATLLTAFIYCRSGYQMRLAKDATKLYLLYSSRHQIYGKPYFVVDGIYFYPLNSTSSSINICNATFKGETPMSLYIGKEQLLGEQLTSKRKIKSGKYPSVIAESQIPQKLIDFFNRYPASAIDGNPMTRWAMYANTPLTSSTKEILYPSLKEAIRDCDEATSANKLLDWVQTGFVYEYDDKVWGQDRAFFAEESLYYPYCDCEDRAILFSRLVRDLLDLDVALVYYPGHLATAVKFNESVGGDAMIIGEEKFIVCDPTYIGAPVGAQMPGLKHDKVQAIVLER